MDLYKFVNCGGINWEWLLCYQEVEGGIRVVFYERWHRFEYRDRQPWIDQCFAIAEEQKLRSCKMVETDGRVATKMAFDEWDMVVDRGIKCYDNHRIVEVSIVNPQYVFSYNSYDEVENWLKTR